MSQTFITIVVAVLAAVLLFQLYNVLGKKVGRQPEDNAGKAKPVGPLGGIKTAEAKAPVVVPIDPALAEAVAGLKARDANFDPLRFAEGARQAYETIVRAYARGDREALRPLLTPAVMDLFEKGMLAREAQGLSETVELVSTPRADIETATADGDLAIASVRFLAELRKTVTTQAGEATTEERRTAEVWTFERRLGAADPNWSLARVAAATA